MEANSDDIGSVLAGACGGVVRWVRTRDGLRGVVGSLCGGSGMGYLTSALIHWQRPEIPADVRVGSAFIAGIVSGLLVEFAMRKVDQLIRRYTTGKPPDGRQPDDPAQPDAKPVAPARGLGGDGTVPPDGY